MTTGQLPIAASATTVTSSIAYATANTASTVVERDGSGNFAAGTITANLTGIASGNVTPTTLDNATLPASLTSVTDSGLTSGYYPLAGTGGLLGNGHLDDGVTVFGEITSSEPLILDYSSTSRVYSELYNATGHAWFINSTGSGGYASAPANSLAFQDGTGMATPLYLTSTSVVALQPVSMPTGSTVNSTAICLADGTGGCVTLGGAVSCSNVTLGSGAGTGASCNSVIGHDSGHSIQITTGTTPAGSLATLFTFAFTTSRSEKPVCAVVPELYQYTLMSQVPITLSGGSTTIYSVISGSTAVPASTSLNFQVVCN
jgi:hypothetical protein